MAGRPGLCEHHAMTEESRPEDRIDLSSLERLQPHAPPPKEPSEWVPRLLATGAFLAVAAVVVAVPWYFLTRTSSPKTQAGRSPSPAAASPSSSPNPSLGPGTYEVTGVEKCVNVRAAPGVSAPVIDCLTVGVRLKSDGKTEDLGGFVWLRIQDPFRRAEGWIATQYLRKVG